MVAQSKGASLRTCAPVGGEGLLQTMQQIRERGEARHQQADGPQDVQVLFLFGRLAPAPGMGSRRSALSCLRVGFAQSWSLRRGVRQAFVKDNSQKRRQLHGSAWAKTPQTPHTPHNHARRRPPTLPYCVPGAIPDPSAAACSLQLVNSQRWSLPNSIGFKYARVSPSTVDSTILQTVSDATSKVYYQRRFVPTSLPGARNVFGTSFEPKKLWVGPTHAASSPAWAPWSDVGRRLSDVSRADSDTPHVSWREQHADSLGPRRCRIPRTHSTKPSIWQNPEGSTGGKSVYTGL